MKKNVKILGAAAAALLAVAPVVASATTVNASDTIVAPSGSTSNTVSKALNINATLNASVGTTAADAASSVKISADNGATVTMPTAANSVQIVDADSLSPVTGPLTSGKQYRVMVTGLKVTNLTTNLNRVWNLGNALVGSGNTTTARELASGVTFYSAPFNLAQEGNTNQPYFTDATGNQIADGAVAYLNGGKGISLPADTSATAANILNAAEHANGLTLVAPSGNGTAWVTSAEDVQNELAKQGMSAKNGVYTIPEGGFHVTLTAKDLSSNKTVSVVIPFMGSEANLSSFPYIQFDGTTAPANGYGYSSEFTGVYSQGKQSKTPSQLVRTVEVGSTFSNATAKDGFKANVSDAAGAASIDVAVLNNPVNTNVPGRYTVTLQATNWANGKTSRLSYIVQVGHSDTTYQTVNYPAAYGVNVWSIAGNTASFTNNRVPGQTRVATYDTRTIDGVSYTRINAADSNTWIQTQYLGNHSNENKPAKPSNNGETKLNGVGRVVYNGKGAVRLLNGEGHYVDQYVKKGASFKVWAEKTVNGQHLYRIGSQSQWIPAKYLPLN